MNSVAPLITIGQINSATVLRTLLSYQVLAATTSIAPSFTSATDPTQTIMGVSTFKKSVGGGTSVSVNALGIEPTKHRGQRHGRGDKQHQRQRCDQSDHGIDQRQHGGHRWGQC